jgi:hypothetical protein
MLVQLRMPVLVLLAVSLLAGCGDGSEAEGEVVLDCTPAPRGNRLNGEPFELPMTHDEPFTNSPPHMGRAL